MAVDPKDVQPGGWYRSSDGQDRLVWIVRDGKVGYFHRERPDQPWTCTQPKDPHPPVDVFAAEVEMMQREGGPAAAIQDVYGGGDW